MSLSRTLALACHMCLWPAVCLSIAGAEPPASVNDDVTLQRTQSTTRGNLELPNTLRQSVESQLVDQFSDETDQEGPELDLYQPGKFENAFQIPDSNVFLKIGGYVKTDAIHDFDAIDSTDSFVVSTIPVGTANRSNTRFHARQTRLNLDARWPGRYLGPTRFFIEGDFFSEGDRFRLRHAYGEAGPLLIGKTWTTFTDVQSLPTTLDFESSVAFVARRQAQIRYTRSLGVEGLDLSLALEDPRNLIVVPEGVTGESRTPTPDFVVRTRYEDDELLGLQLAVVVRELGFQPEGESVNTGTAWGLNLSGHIQLSDDDNLVFQVVGGEGIGSYWGVPDAAPTGPVAAEVLPITAWMIGYAHQWTETVASNFTYSQSRIDNTPLQSQDDIHGTNFLAANVIWNPLERVYVGMELLHGIRTNANRESQSATRLQFSAAWFLP